VRALLRKEFNYIKEYENERLQISKNIINTRPIYKQLQFEQEQPPPQNTQPLNYNHATTSQPTSRIKPANPKHPFLEKNQTVPLPTHSPAFKKENKSLLIELTQSISHNFKTEYSEEPDTKKSKTDKNKFKKITKKDENTDTICNALKKNLMKDNQNTPQAKQPVQQVDQTSLSLLKPPLLEK
jgi:hypothetical protein